LASEQSPVGKLDEILFVQISKPSLCQTLSWSSVNPHKTYLLAELVRTFIMSFKTNLGLVALVFKPICNHVDLGMALEILLDVPNS
jgi:hypothetical protein